VGKFEIRDPLYTTFQKIFTIIRIFLKSEAPKAPGLFTFVHRGGLDKSSDAQPKIGGFGCFKGVLQIPFFLLMQFHKAIFYFNPNPNARPFRISGIDP